MKINNTLIKWTYTWVNCFQRNLKSLTPSYYQNSGERQRTFSGNALYRSPIKTSPFSCGIGLIVIVWYKGTEFSLQSTVRNTFFHAIVTSNGCSCFMEATNKRSWLGEKRFSNEKFARDEGSHQRRTQPAPCSCTASTFNSCTKCVGSPGKLDDSTPDCNTVSWT